MEIKELFAREPSSLPRPRSADKAAKEFGQIYAADALPDAIGEHELTTEGAGLCDRQGAAAAGLVKSTGEGKRLVEQGGVEVDRVRVTDANRQLERGKHYLLRVGSKNRRFAYVTVA